jgi:uncharacterized protein DUF4136
MKRMTTLVLAGFVLAAAGAARAQDVKVDYDKATNFGAIKTFSIKLGTAWGNPIGEKRVTDQVTEALIAKGWTLAPEDKADAQVVLHGASQTKHSLNTYYSGMGGYRWGGMGTATTTSSEYVVGTLLVDIFDAKGKNLIWRGVAQDEASDKAEKNIKKVSKALEKLFKDFPPGSVTKK